jgi:hypothetical protein
VRLGDTLLKYTYMGTHDETWCSLRGEQDRQYPYNVTLRRVHETVVAEEKQ